MFEWNGVNSENRLYPDARVEGTEIRNDEENLSTTWRRTTTPKTVCHAAESAVEGVKNRMLYDDWRNSFCQRLAEAQRVTGVPGSSG